MNRDLVSTDFILLCSELGDDLNTNCHWSVGFKQRLLALLTACVKSEVWYVLVSQQGSGLA